MSELNTKSISRRQLGLQVVAGTAAVVAVSGSDSVQEVKEGIRVGNGR